MLSEMFSSLRTRIKSLDSLEDLLAMDLRELHDLEQQMSEAMPKFGEACSSGPLKAAFERHQDQTTLQRQRLDQAFRLLGMEPESLPCAGMRGLIDEGMAILSAKGDPAVKDAALIGCVQRIKHYEIGAYGTVRTFAQMLGLTEVARLLQQTLDEEGMTDKELTAIAMSGVNQDARKPKT